jgi:amino acid adenylation domain-containing protein
VRQPTEGNGLPSSSEHALYLLTDTQRTVLLDSMLTPEAPRFTLPLIIEIHGSPRLSAIKQTINSLVERHPALRTRIVESGGELFQTFPPCFEFEPSIYDITADPGQEAIVLQRLLWKPIDTASSCFNSGIILVSSERTICVIVAHHVVLDGNGANLLNQDFAELYHGYAHSSGYTPEPISDGWEKLVSGIRRNTDGSIEGADLRCLEPVNRVHAGTALRNRFGSAEDYACVSARLNLTAEQFHAIATVAAARSATPAMFLLTAFSILERRLGIRPENIGVPIGIQPDGPAAVGMLVQMISVPVPVSADRQFYECLEQMRDICLEAYRRAEEGIVSTDLASGIGPFEWMFNYALEDPEERRYRCGDTEIWNRRPPVIAELARLPLTAYVFAGKQKYIELLAAKSKFSQTRIEQILEQYVALIKQAIANPETAISGYSLSSGGLHRSCLPDPTRLLPCETQPTVMHLIAGQARANPDAVAIEQGGQTVTYGALINSVKAQASVLSSIGIRKGNHVGIHGYSGTGFVIQFLAVLQCGAVAVPIAGNTSAGRVKVQLEEGRCICLLADADLRDEALLHEVETYRYHPETGALLAWNELQESRDAETGIQPQDAAYVFFTSGTTGNPKAILGTHNGLSHFLCWEQQEFKIRCTDRFAQFTSISFDVMLRDILVPLISGATLCIPSNDFSLAAENALPWLAENRITCLHSVPTILSSWLQLPMALPHLRLLFSAGEPLTGVLADGIRKAFGVDLEVVNLYGPTETTMAKCCYRVPFPALTGVQPVGYSIPGSQALVVNSCGMLCGLGEPGEVYIRTPYRTAGYVNIPQGGSFQISSFTNDPQDIVYCTGDRGWYMEDGALVIDGRFDFQIKIEGVRIEPEGVQAVLQAHLGTVPCAVLAGRTEQGTWMLEAFIAVEQPENLDARQIRRHLAQLLPAAAVPSRYYVVPALPQTPNGKLNRQELTNMIKVMLPQTVKPVDIDAPNTATERRILKIWQQLLGEWAADAQVTDSFFALGGTSLSAARVLALIKQELGAAVSLKAFLEEPTISGLASRLTDLASLDTGSRLVLNRSSEDPLQPSAGQVRCYLKEQLMPGTSFNNVTINVRLAGPVDIAALQSAFEMTLRRHTVLWHTLYSVDGVALLKRLDFAPHVEVVEVADSARLIPEAENAAAKPVAFNNGPLIRATLFSAQGTEHIFSLNMNHAITDGWSSDLLIREILDAYFAFVDGKQPVLAEPGNTYFDYVQMANSEAAIDRNAAQIEYWREQLKGAQPSEIVGDRGRPEIRRYPGRLFRSRISQNTYSALCALARQEETTPFAATAALYGALLARFAEDYTGEVVFGIAAAGRTDTSYYNTVGMFMNTLILRLDISLDATPRKAVRRAASVTLDALKHQDVPFEEVVQALNPRRAQNRNPLFDVMLIFDNPAEPLPSSAELQTEEVRICTGAAYCDLTLRVTPDNGELVCEWLYDTDLYEEATIQELDSAWHMLVESAVNVPDAPVNTLNLLTSAQKHRLFEEWNDTACPLSADVSVISLFDNKAAESPDAIAAAYDSITHTYAELCSLSQRVASGIVPLLNPQDEIPCAGVYLNRSLDMLVSTLGVMRAGAAYVPLDPGYPLDRLKQVIEDSGMRCIITSADLAAKAAEMAPGCTLLLVEELSRAETVPLKPVDQSKAAYILYTSGSTGRPKGVAIPHRALINFLISMKKLVGVNPSDRIVATTTLSFDISCLELYLPLISGACTVIASREDAMDGTALSRIIADKGVNIVQATPTGWQVLIASGWQGGPGIKAISGGEPLQPDVAEQLLKRVGTLWNMYGPTETTVWSTACPIKHSNPPILVGKPIDNTQLYILDEARQPVPPGRVGELWIGGDGLATGYVNLPELTAERFVCVPSAGGQRLYRSGDLARWTPDGQIQCLGRADGQVKLRGYRIETGDVEAALMRHPSVAKCAVVLAGDGQDAFLAAFVVTEEGADFGAVGMRGTLREHVHSLLPAYMASAEYVRLPELPLTPNAKVDRKALRAQAAVRATASEERVWTPTDPLEAQVAEIWERYLHKPVQPEDDFFDLGGHSLMAVNLLETIASVTGIRLRLDVLFKAPTVRSMSAAMRSVRVDVPARCLVPIHPEGDLAPMFFVHGMGGGLLDARALAACVNPNRPFYGLQSAGMDPNVAPVETVEQMAKEYLSEVLAAAPFGPITLVGHCTIGGVIAYEMARQMLAMGRPEPTLIMIDTEYRTGSYWSPDDDISHSKIYQVFRTADYHWARFARQSGLFAKCKYGWNVVAEAVQSRIRPNALAGVPHLQKLHETNLAAVLKYECPEYRGMVHHIVSTGASTVGYLHRRLSWSEATTVDCRFVRGEHSDLLLGNSAGTIAEMIEAIILRVEKKAADRRANR